MPPLSACSSSIGTSGCVARKSIRAPYIGGFPGDQRQQCRGKPEHVAGGDRPTRKHLRSHVPRSPHSDRPGYIRIQCTCDAEVDQHDPVLAEDQIGGLHIAMHDLLFVHVSQRLACLQRVLDDVGHRQAWGAALLQQSTEVPVLRPGP